MDLKVINRTDKNCMWRTSYLVFLAGNYFGDLTETDVVKGKLIWVGYEKSASNFSRKT